VDFPLVSIFIPTQAKMTFSPAIGVFYNQNFTLLSLVAPKNNHRTPDALMTFVLAQARRCPHV
jgi:hypothetical protein